MQSAAAAPNISTILFLIISVENPAIGIKRNADAAAIATSRIMPVIFVCENNRRYECSGLSQLSSALGVSFGSGDVTVTRRLFLRRRCESPLEPPA